MVKEIMNGSTLHRSGLTRENMGVLATYTHAGKRPNAKNQLNQFYKTTKAQELDLLWDVANKGMQKVKSVTKGTTQKSPASYFTIGFISGILCMCALLLLVSLFSMTPRNLPTEETKSDVTVIGDEAVGAKAEEAVTQEKYIVKSGDTLNGIVYRYYGKYNEEKILEIQRLNNITNVASLKIGQELIIPVATDR